MLATTTAVLCQFNMWSNMIQPYLPMSNYVTPYSPSFGTSTNRPYGKNNILLSKESFQHQPLNIIYECFCKIFIKTLFFSSVQIRCKSHNVVPLGWNTEMEDVCTYSYGPLINVIMQSFPLILLQEIHTISSSSTHTSTKATRNSILRGLLPKSN